MYIFILETEAGEKFAILAENKLTAIDKWEKLYGLIYKDLSEKYLKINNVYKGEDIIEIGGN